ncbi:hypothetical protein ACHAXA_007962 [Cyclostephanos tholiformis]|uniref:Uncharacterized protein n=1 Tax=Cyclostephanos tholiformis TaxID=382380 RepID=A0ABD3RCI9_9STRA
MLTNGLLGQVKPRLSAQIQLAGSISLVMVVIGTKKTNCHFAHALGSTHMTEAWALRSTIAATVCSRLILSAQKQLGGWIQRAMDAIGTRSMTRRFAHTTETRMTAAWALRMTIAATARARRLLLRLPQRRSMSRPNFRPAVPPSPQPPQQAPLPHSASGTHLGGLINLVMVVIGTRPSTRRAAPFTVARITAAWESRMTIAVSARALRLLLTQRQCLPHCRPIIPRPWTGPADMGVLAMEYAPERKSAALGLDIADMAWISVVSLNMFPHRLLVPQSHSSNDYLLHLGCNQGC